jgi:hypothetical protein
MKHATTSCHVSLSSVPHLAVEVDSDAALRLMAPEPASMFRRATTLSHVLQLRTPPPYRGGLRRCHTSYDSGPNLSVGEGSAVLCEPRGT